MQELINMFTYIISGIKITLGIFGVTLVLSIPLGVFCSVMLARFPKKLSVIINPYTSVFRGTPLLLQIIFMYYGLGVMGIRFSPFQAGVIAFSLNYGAYFTEIIRGGIESIPKGQFEAFKVMGMTYFQGMKRVILPQAVKNVIPSLCNEVINLVKDTALMSVLGIGDVLRNSKEIVTREFTIVPLIIAAGIYLVISSVIISCTKKVEKKFDY